MDRRVSSYLCSLAIAPSMLQFYPAKVLAQMYGPGGRFISTPNWDPLLGGHFDSCSAPAVATDKEYYIILGPVPRGQRSQGKGSLTAAQFPAALHPPVMFLPSSILFLSAGDPLEGEHPTPLPPPALSGCDKVGRSVKAAWIHALPSFFLSE